MRYFRVTYKFVVRLCWFDLVKIRTNRSTYFPFSTYLFCLLFLLWIHEIRRSREKWRIEQKWEKLRSMSSFVGLIIALKKKRKSIINKMRGHTTWSQSKDSEIFCHTYAINSITLKDQNGWSSVNYRQTNYESDNHMSLLTIVFEGQPDVWHWDVMFFHV
jgi:hypothetical protein